MTKVASCNLTPTFPCPWASHYLLTLTVLSCIQIATQQFLCQQNNFDPLQFRRATFIPWEASCCVRSGRLGVHCTDTAWVCMTAWHCMTPACCSSLSGGLVSTWLWMSALEAVFLFATSGPVFYYYYARSNVTLDKWMYKSNPKYPSPEKVLIRFFALFLFPTVTSVTNCFYRDKTTASSAQQRLVSSFVFSNLRI